MKKLIIKTLLFMLILLSAFSIASFADNNATGGEGTTHGATTGYAWYQVDQYMWKVTIFAGKNDQVTKTSNLTNDFYRIGTVILKKKGWTMYEPFYFGDKTKIDYYSGTKMERVIKPFVVEQDILPKVPIICGTKNIDEVKKYFGSTGTMNQLLNNIAANQKTTAYGLLKAKTFSIGGVSKSGWSSDYLLPNGTKNRIPWVIVYEPIITMHLKDGETKVAFTASEYALSAKYGWYDWDYSNGKGQKVAIAPYSHLPSSVQLEESWFGYPVYPVHNDSYRWPIDDIVKGGGWGMRWLPIAIKEPDGTDYSVEIIEYDDAPTVNKNTSVKVKWKNNKSSEGTVPVELWQDDELIWKGEKTLPGNSSITSTITFAYDTSGSKVLTAKINYANRGKEINPNNNITTATSNVKHYYDFAIKDIEVTPTEVKQNETVTIKFKTESFDKEIAYENVPIQILVNGKVVYTKYLNYPVNGAFKHTYKINIGESIGSVPIVARINWKDHTNEVNPDNNITDTKYVTVKEAMDLSIEAIEPNSDYREGIIVITSFNMINSGKDIIPDNNNTVKFVAYYYEGSTKKVISEQKWEKAVIPKNENNLVYFKWTVPKIAGKKVYCEATVNADNTITESDKTNNKATLTRTVAKVITSQTPDTKYERSKPNGFTLSPVPSAKTGSAKWSMWEYVNGAFSKKTYGIAISSGAPTITPDSDSPSAVKENGSWKMKSGYGIKISYPANLVSISGVTSAPSSAYTQVQRAEAFFPEFMYSTDVNKFRTLELASGVWQFVKNENTDGNERMHFTPIWFPNGNYTISVIATELWTPAGMIESRRNSNNITITESAYDDWYVRR